MDQDKKSQAISVRQFVTARTQELAALSTRVQSTGASTSSGNQSTSKTTSTIPYQHIPKHLRRRAVSHNVKRIPSRFRPTIPSSSVQTVGGNKNTSSTTKGSESNLQGPLSFVSSKKKKKQFSRKHRRRKSNLLSQYNRRQRIHKWMETHIWHAKRFHMGLKWNCKIPLAPCEKGQRALYRSAKQYVTMQDVSFISCLELQGDYETICEGFKSIAPKQSNTLSLAALMFRSGEREGKLQIYHKNSYPVGYIGEIQFMWVKPSSSEKLKENDEDKDLATLWLWVHPGFKNEFILELTNLFNLEQVVYKEQGEGEKNLDNTKEKLTIDEIKLIPKNLHCKPTWTNSSTTTTTNNNNNEKKIILTDLFGELNRLRFYGPEILSVLKEVLHISLPEIPSYSTTLPPVSRLTDELSSNNNESSKWIDNFFLKQSTKQRHDYLLAQKLLWKVVEDVQDFSCQTILPLIVRDPRVFLPGSRTKVLRDFYQDANTEEDEFGTEKEMDIETKEKEEEDMEVETVSEHTRTNKSKQVVNKDDNEMIDISKVFNKFLAIATSPLSNPEYRLKLVKEKMTDAEYCQKRSQLLIPGSQIDLGVDENQIPIILIQRTSTSNSKNFSDGGFDLILPSGWTMAFWIAFVYRAVRVGGLRDSKTFAFEAGALHSPPFFGPDSQTGFQDANETGKDTRETFFKLPPAKRANLIKLNCTCPFSPDWNFLLHFWKTRHQFQKHDEKCEPISSAPSSSSSSPMEISPAEEEEERTASSETTASSEMSKFYILRDIEILKMIKKLYKSRKWSELYNFLTNSLPSANLIQDPDSCLLGVKLQSWNRGKATKGAVICLPAQSDFDNLKRRKVIHVGPEPSSSSIVNYADPGKRNVSDPPIYTEPPHDDKETNRRRTELRQKHQKIMAYLRKKRKKFRDKSTQAQLEFQQTKAIRLQPKQMNGSATNINNSSGTSSSTSDNFDKLLSDMELYKESISHFDSTTISKLYNETFNDLWLVSGENDKSKEKILQSFRKNSRIPAGFVVYGSDEYSRGKCAALGYITLASLLELSRLFAEEETATKIITEQEVQESTIQKSTAPFLLVRNWMDSAIYRQVKCDILLL